MGAADKYRKALGAAIERSDETAKPTYLPVGIPAIDYALGGGFMEGRLSELIGESTVGKSLIADLLLIANQKRGGVSAKFNAEQAHNPFFFEQLGGSGNDLILRPEEGQPVLYIEDVFIEMETLLEARIAEPDGPPLAIAWDSIAATQAQAVSKKTLKQVDMKYNLARAQALSNCCPRILHLAQQSKAIVLATNQIRDSPDPFERDTVTPGGKSWPFACSQRIELRKSGTIKSDSGEKIGHWIQGEVIKNRLDSALRTFRVPTYTRYDLPHPIYETPMQPGIHLAEALWEFCYGRKGKAKEGENEDSSKITPYFLMPDGLPVLALEGKGWYMLHKKFGGKKFRKADWPAVVQANPTLNDLPKVSA